MKKVILPKVSVIITTFGNPLFLGKAIESVLNQSFTDIELIVVDDNNPDTEDRIQTENILTNFLDVDHRIIYLKHDCNFNGAVARNSGLAVANGKYIAFLDNDDEYYPERLAKCINLMEQCEANIAGVYTGCEFRVSGQIYHIHKNVQPGNFIVNTLACNFMFGSGSNIFVRKRVIDELNGFDESFLRHQDYEFLVRLFENHSLAAIPEVLLIKNNENMNLPKVEAIIEIKEQYLNKFNSVIESLKEDDKRYIYIQNYISIAEHALKSRRIGLSIKFYNRAKDYGSLSMNVVLRRLVLILFFFRKW
jgi:glycosyltransferase involved in cell wall biosynthesis